MADRIGKPISQRQLRVGEMIKQSLSMIFIRNEAKVPNLETNTITVTEVRMSPDLKIAKAYVLPLGGKDAEACRGLLVRDRLRRAAGDRPRLRVLAPEPVERRAVLLEDLVKVVRHPHRRAARVGELVQGDRHLGQRAARLADHISRALGADLSPPDALVVDELN